MKKAPEQYRYKKGELTSDASYGNNGFFVFPHYKIVNYEIRCQISDGEGWEHVSVSIAKARDVPTRCPTWTEMCWVKDQFWHKEECVIQYHPAESEYVNNHTFCLHLWKPTNYIIPVPPKIFVGI